MNKLTVFHFLVAIILLATQINIDIFGNATMAAFFFYVIAAAILISLTGFYYLKSKQKLPAFNYWPLLFFFLLVLWYFVQLSFLSAPVISTIHIFMAVNLFALVAFTILLKSKALNIQMVFKVITALAFFESAVCIMQSLGWVNSQNEYLPVSGTWINPNVTAMFLAISFPAIIYSIVSPSVLYRKIYILILVLIITALILLKCRTAILGVLVAAIFFFSSYYNVKALIKYKFSLTKQILLLITTVIIIIPSGFYLYKSKQASADGRQLIWKVSTNMIAQKPLAGVGYGMFEHDYNLQQADYFANNAATSKEIENASFTHMAYNEFLQNAVEGGFYRLGFICCISSFCFNPTKKE